MSQSYTKEINAQVVISLLKAHGINKVIASPGTTNVALIGSIQTDPFFTIYSAVDERSAAYMACGLSEESGEPVVISCTGATASRNYAPGLTEAYYRKLPILAITSMQSFAKVGHLVAQTLDRSSIQNDIAKLSVTLPIVKDDDDTWECEIKVNQAILELKRNGGGPVHINLPTTYTLPFVSKELPKYRFIDRIRLNDKHPSLVGKVAVFAGAHKKLSTSETEAIDIFCSVNNAVVFCDHTSSYKGKYRVLTSLLSAQTMMDKSQYKPEVIIHIGEVTGDYSSLCMIGREVWRVSEDGEIRDTFRKLRYVFEMAEENFFTVYSEGKKQDDSYLKNCQSILEKLKENIPQLPFSNIWIASQIAQKLPSNAVVHLAILNSLRSWNFFDVPESVTTGSNVGGFGIDGGLSTLVGSSLHKPNCLYFSVIGDLAFFYDMNVIGNRHIGKNLRILLINNGKGTEFRQYNHHAAYFGEAGDKFIAAAEHFGNKSPTLVKQYAENLGFEYLCASSKNDFKLVAERFISPKITERPMLLEVFTNSEEESAALEAMNTIIQDRKLKSKLKEQTKKLLGNKGLRAIKRIIRS
jgi:2-succinyl-5-enolpyruvyl-6-hydroxy-3-cyclohexene-1-carboxylate synthase